MNDYLVGREPFDGSVYRNRNKPTRNRKLKAMKNMTKLKLSLTSLALALPLVTSGCSHSSPQADNMSSNSMATHATDNMTPSQMGHMESNSMNMAGSSMNNMTSNKMNMANSPQTGNMMSDSMRATNQSK